MSLFELSRVKNNQLEILDDVVIIKGHTFERFKLREKEFFDNLYMSGSYDKSPWEFSFAHGYSHNYLVDKDGDLVVYKEILGYVCVFHYKHRDRVIKLYHTPIPETEQQGLDIMKEVLSRCAIIISDINENKQVVFDCFDADLYKELFVAKNLYRSETVFPDFIFKTSDIVELKGKRYTKRRNMVNTFKKNYPTAFIRPYKDSDLEDVITVRANWDKYKEKIIGEEVWDKNIVISLIKDRDSLGLYVNVVEIDGKVEAFSVVSQLFDNCFSFINRNCNMDIRGLSEFLWYESTKVLSHLGEYFNDGNGGRDDKDGLYLYKKTHNPILILPKKMITLNAKDKDFDHNVFKRS